MIDAKIGYTFDVVIETIRDGVAVGPERWINKVISYDLTVNHTLLLEGLEFKQFIVLSPDMNVTITENEWDSNSK